MDLSTQTSNVKLLLGLTRVATLEQLKKYDLTEAVSVLGLPIRGPVTCKTRTTQPDSLVDLTFVALEAKWLNSPRRDLMHYAGLSELLCLTEAEDGAEWHLVDLKGREPGRMPDAEIIFPRSVRRHDIFVEFDAGYSRDAVTDKLRAAARSGYSRVLWACSIHGRLSTIASIADTLQRTAQLEGVERLEVVWVDFWSLRDTYSGRPRCHKPNRVTREYPPRLT
jgi:hypothetical protein